MKSLKQLAAEINCYPVNEMPLHYFENEYFKNNFEHATNKSYDKKEIPEFLLNMPNIEVGIFFEVKRQNKNFSDELDCYYIEHSYIFCKHVNSENVCLLRQDSRNKKFSFMPNFTALNKFNGVSNYERREALKDIKEPNLIGVFTEKKVIDWLNYCDLYIEALNNLKNGISNKVEDAQIEVNNFIASLNGKCKVSKWDNSTQVETAFFTITFKIDKSNGYLSQTLRPNVTIADITKITNLCN